MAANRYLINIVINNTILKRVNKICGYLCILTTSSELSTALITVKDGLSWKGSHWLLIVG